MGGRCGLLAGVHRSWLGLVGILASPVVSTEEAQRAIERSAMNYQEHVSRPFEKSQRVWFKQL
jgi:hypothetical protein